MAGESVSPLRRGGDPLGLDDAHFDLAVAALSAVMIAGLTWDFYRHAADAISFAEEGFLTLQHAIVYAAFLGIAVLIGGATVAERRRGADWIAAVPSGYRLGVLGVAIFALGGVGDLLWHSAFGFEASTEVLVSPSHLALAAGGALFLSSPLRAVWARHEAPSGLAMVAVVLSTAFVLTVLSLFGGLVNPILQPLAAYGTPASINQGLVAYMVYPALFVGTGVTLARRFSLQSGTLTAVFGLVGLFCGLANGHLPYALAAVVTGLVADAAVRWRRPTPANPRALRLFAGLLPVAFVGTHLLVVELQSGIAWSIHLWPGSVVVSALFGLLVSYAIVPSRGVTP